MKDRSVRIALWICAILFVLHAIYFARTLLAPLVVAFLAYLTLRPVAGRLQKYGLGPNGAAIFLLAAILGGLALSVVTVIQPAQQWAMALPDRLAQLEGKFASVNSPLAAIEDATKKVESIAEDEAAAEDAPVEVQVAQPRWTDKWYLVNGTSTFVGFGVMVVVLVFFLLATGDAMINRILHVLPSFGDRRRVVSMIVDMQSAISTYLGQVTMINAGLGIAVAIAMYLRGMPTPLLWGTLAMLLNYIPYLGALCGAAVVFLTAAMTPHPIMSAVVTTGLYLTLTTIEGQFITPALLGKTLRLSPLMVLLSLAFWGWMWGLIGIFVAVPLLIVMRLAFENFPSTIPLAVLIGGDEDLLETDEDQNSSATGEPTDARAERGQPGELAARSGV